MLDKSVPFFPLIFVRWPDKKLPAASLPSGFSIQTWEPGAADDWCAIETAVDEFKTIDDARVRFNMDFAPHREALSQRLFFVVSPEGQRIGNCAAWWQQKGDHRRCLLHYLAVIPDYQGLGLGRVLVRQVVEAFNRLNPDEPVYLGTQTWSWRAVCLYLSFNFQLTEEKNPEKALPYLQQKMPLEKYQKLIDTRLDHRWEGIAQN